MRSIRAIRRPGGWLAAGAAIAAAALVPPGCDGSLAPPIPGRHDASAFPRRGGTLRLASFQDIRTLDPAGPGDGLTLQAERLIFAGLVDIDAQGRIAPELAERWTVEDEGRTYRFALRHGVIMQDGQELTADDVKRSVERALSPETPNPNASYFEGIVGFSAFASGQTPHLEGVEADAEYAVSFRLRAPDATFLAMLTMPTLWPVCRTAGRRFSDTWNPCGAGPFELSPDGWQRGTQLRLDRHPSYFRSGLPYLDAVLWSFNMPVLAQRFRFEAGELDLVRDLTQSDAWRFVTDPRWRGLSDAEGDTRIYGESMNTRMAPFDNVEIRRAVASALNREHYRALKPGYVTVLTQLLPSGIPGYDPALAGQAYDLTAALEHMRKAGYPFDPVTGKGGWPHVIEYPLYDQGLLVRTAQVLQQDLAKIGLRIELHLMSWQAFLAVQGRPGGAAMSQGNWEMDYPDPSSFFEPLFTTSAIGPDASHNSSFYSNPRFDALVSRARGEIRPSQRQALYREANAILCDDAPWAFAFSYHFLRIHQGYVRGLVAHPSRPLDLTPVWLDREPDALEHAMGMR